MHSFSWKNPLRLIRLRREYEKEILLGLTLALSLGTFCLIGCGNTSGEADASNSLEEAVEITVESDLDESETSAKVATTEPELEATDNAGTGETEGALVAASQSDWVGDWTVVCTKVRRGKVGEEPETTTVFSGFIINSVLINDDFTGAFNSYDGQSAAFTWQIQDPYLILINCSNGDTASSFMCSMNKEGQIEMMSFDLGEDEDSSYTSHSFTLSKDGEPEKFPYDPADATDIMDASLLRGHWDLCAYMQENLSFQGDVSILNLGTELIPSLEFNEGGTGTFTSFFDEEDITWFVDKNGAVVSMGEMDLSLKCYENMLLLVCPSYEHGDMYYFFDNKAE